MHVFLPVLFSWLLMAMASNLEAMPSKHDHACFFRTVVTEAFYVTVFQLFRLKREQE